VKAVGRIPVWLLAVALIACFRPQDCPGAEHDFDKWEKEIAAFEAMDRTNPPPRDGLLFIGSSNIRLWKSLAADFPGRSVINRGFGGSEIVDSTHFAARIIFPCHPRMVYLRAGGNDLWGGKSPTQVFEDFKEFADTVRKSLPDTGIVFVSMNPSIARWKQADKEKEVNEMIEAYCKGRPGLGYIETYSVPLGPDGKPRAELFEPDKLHFNAAGYKLLADCVRPALPK